MATAMAACPRCAFEAHDAPSCPRCGVVFAKLRPRPAEANPPDAPPAVPAPSRFRVTPPPAPEPGLSPFWPLALLGALVLAAVGWLRAARPHESAAPAPLRPPVRTSAPAAPPAVAAVPPPRPATLTADAPKAPRTLTDAEYQTFEGISSRISAGQVTAADVDGAMALQARFPGEKPIEGLVSESMLGLAYQQLRARRFAEAVALLRRAARLPWADDRIRQGLLTALMQSEDWPAVETYANQLLAANRRHAEAWYALGYALFRLDRNAEAAEALKNRLALGDDAEAQSLLARIDKSAADERGMTAQNLSHFNVHYDGDEHAEVGHEIVRALERHYATLESRLDHRPANVVPVILFSSERYYEASGAPIWSGGNFDSLDGRIRVPIAGLTRSLSPDLDNVLIHELTHAFVADRTRGIAPRDLHEGLAQYMEGKRLSTAEAEAIARGRVGGVGGFYATALGFAEYLVDTRGMGGMNDLLQAMGATGSVDQAFRQVYGQSYPETQKAYGQRLYQRYGG
jgi:tetratricopeptide (TPR) repeat protein